MKTVLNITDVIKNIIPDIVTIKDIPFSDKRMLNESDDVANKTHEDDLNILSSICRGCSKELKVLIKHLNSKTISGSISIVISRLFKEVYQKEV